MCSVINTLARKYKIGLVTNSYIIEYSSWEMIDDEKEFRHIMSQEVAQSAELYKLEAPDFVPDILIYCNKELREKEVVYNGEIYRYVWKYINTEFTDRSFAVLEKYNS